MGSPDQFVLDLPVRVARGRADYLVTQSNALAVEWVDRWPEWPGHLLVLCGPPKSGKTHLAQVWCQRSGAVFLEKIPATQEIPDLVGAATVCLDINGMLGNEESAFHFYNWTRENGVTVLLTALEAPKAWIITLPDLRSRLLASPVVTLGPPDDVLLMAVMAKLFADRQISVTNDVLQYLLTRVERSFAAVHDMVVQLDEAAMREGRAITIPLARQLMTE